jgi:1,4-alpha-glucan branching enzyme
MPEPTTFQDRCLRQAARELLLAQASDWPFILRTGTSPEYATRRVREHVERFRKLSELARAGQGSEDWLAETESRDNLFPHLDYRYYA